MRQVRTCDFCGDDAAGLYEPYPPSVPDGPRMLLCSGCRDRLSSVVDPLVAALEEGSDGNPGAPSSPEPHDEVEDAPARDADDSGDADAGPDTDVDTGADTRADADADAGTSIDPDGGAGDPAPTAGESARNTDPATAAGVGESRDAGGRPKRERGGTPPGYRKVMRLLENRELPMDRAEATQLAAEAYELDEETVADAIDHAVQYGRLREVRGELTR